MSSGFENDPHSERGSSCPRNFFGITDYTLLQRIEGPLVAKRSGELEDKGVTGEFDIPHLKSIHQYLFQDVFPWAGEFRTVNISKGNSPFGPAQYLIGALTDVLDKLNREHLLVGTTSSLFAQRAGFYLGEINAVHPFREGNGRTQRAFIQQLGLRAGHPLFWGGFTQQQMTDASILAHTRGDYSKLAAILDAALLSNRTSL